MNHIAVELLFFTVWDYRKVCSLTSNRSSLWLQFSAYGVDYQSCMNTETVESIACAWHFEKFIVLADVTSWQGRSCTILLAYFPIFRSRLVWHTPNQWELFFIFFFFLFIICYGQIYQQKCHINNRFLGKNSKRTLNVIPLHVYHLSVFIVMRRNGPLT